MIIILFTPISFISKINNIVIEKSSKQIDILEEYFLRIIKHFLIFNKLFKD